MLLIKSYVLVYDYNSNFLLKQYDNFSFKISSVLSLVASAVIPVFHTDYWRHTSFLCKFNILIIYLGKKTKCELDGHLISKALTKDTTSIKNRTNCSFDFRRTKTLLRLFDLYWNSPEFWFYE